mmetsp:Transcript_31255/g.79704  ORF Transcript_31255/g.79704 Transcript_31255/m.79704 type:complete len:224 (-) Transcript_31255:1850-2521(-)|eukprot:CAMPEP_0202859466 /NCGR_PEP_ID=MMETSP1391-20130828/1560_1 /ASSEMBLY_ACC=CAM_ASM_000867 /TAXON_ID=1034604 /ORGANISM="Chlamydomonas leiostraca, Strain SAG 11-49" /LENGTH=223 /DNA_ID=CAMNT_0049538499 /DNA_START=111 /DNA_END=782 /DNA_ORIENTATION=-
MSDDWEEWETKEVVPVAAAPAPAPTASSLAAGIDMSKFADEEVLAVEDTVHTVVGTQPKKKVEKVFNRNTLPVDKPLDDPVAEKLRQQRLVEQADFAAAKELFGDAGEQVNLDLFLPKTLKEFEDFAAAITSRYVVGHFENKNYKGFLKALFKAACAPLSSQETKDLETSLAGIRTDKHKAEQAEAAAKKGTKKQLNVGRTGGTAGLDDYIYDDAPGDDYDFM